MGVLVTLTGAAPGCGYDNPGFKLKDSDPVTSTDEPTTNVSGVTVTSEPNTTTAIPTTSTTESMTTQGPGVSGSETSTTDVDPTTSTTETTGTTTGGGNWVFPTQCAQSDQLPTGFQEAAADTFFISDVPQFHCEGLPMDSQDQCQDLEFGTTEEWSLYFQDNNENYTKDFMSVFAVRFAPPTFIHEDVNGMVLVPPEAFVRAEVRMRVFRGAEDIIWQGTELGVFRFGPNDAWVEGEGFDLTPCTAPAPSFRCQVCPENGGEDACSQSWSSGGAQQPMPVGAQPVLTMKVLMPPPPGGSDLSVKDLTKAEIAWLTTEGMMLFPTFLTPRNMLVLKTRNFPKFEYKPAMLAYYCKPDFIPD